MSTIDIGGVEVERVVEWVGPLMAVDTLFPDTPGDEWNDDLAPDHWVPDSRAYRAAIQTWVLRSQGRVILIDTGVGNDRDRPQIPPLSHLNTDFLGQLAAVGVQPGDVDVVVNTHIHYDHVGWNTRLADGRWEPTFPNATYVVPQADYEYYHPDNAHRMRAPRTEDERARFEGIRLVFADSIAPVYETGQMTTHEGGYRIDARLRIEPAPGHTPGSSVVWLDAPDGGAVFVGDLVHTPLQIGRPGDCCALDLDADGARASRRAVLAEAGRRGSTLLPAHFAGRGAARLGMTDSDPVIEEWADLPRI
ncbi:MBL fold metallo-hydrolase [Tsukamurella sp. 8F]|uniref:MBL fold metallo-hydrolase n=1 Tax=unclassified Tsukamurella TaxID=2633480 RepID=UPI0023B91B5E|nr:MULTISPECIES: MBL fold metallo-hydrolase [unclassified Tsukamurella]MDF0530190.1 MBL fold metallo-hydrolase [Tsukamurella sp. 8J]MDF0586507.1 MBL fold metallo-hydrolase [Tsukamurella sp. 8F]